MSVLRDFLDEKADGLHSAYVGKVGLALSGGGFRAALFHLGVLAKLAELDVLRHVEVLSCVSGGSIVGAHYYLELRRALQRHLGPDMKPEVYIVTVRKVIDDFVQSLSSDIRTSAFLNPIAWPRMLNPADSYNRTKRIGELFEERLYDRVEDGHAKGTPRPLTSLLIQPQDGPRNFHPRRHNWSRSAKVPILILNATTLNTGHNWQFTASWMGEPPSTSSREIDGNYRLRRMYLREAPEPHKTLTLGTAVAASAAVPGLFRPVVLKGLYPGKVVRLVDGGVRDNQGVYGLLEQDCNVLLVSDASGQMSQDDDPSWFATRVLKRANSVLMAAVRTAWYRELDAGRRASRLRRMLFVHLKKGLEVRDVEWAPGESAPAAGDDRKKPAGYGIPKEMQRALAAIRTDLDDFSRDEAHALMLSGYRMVEEDAPLALRSLVRSGAARVKWPFLEIEHLRRSDEAERRRYDELLENLRRGRHRFFRRALRTLATLRRTVGLQASDRGSD